MIQPEPTIEELQGTVEKLLTADKFLTPFAFFCTPMGNFGLGIGESFDNDVTKVILTENIVNVIKQHHVYKVLLIHESWVYLQPDVIDDEWFKEICESNQADEYCTKEEGYTITEITKHSAKIFLRRFKRNEKEIVFNEEGSVTDASDLNGFEMFKEALYVAQ